MAGVELEVGWLGVGMMWTSGAGWVGGGGSPFKALKARLMQLAFN